MNPVAPVTSTFLLMSRRGRTRVAARARRRGLSFLVRARRSGCRGLQAAEPCALRKELLALLGVLCSPWQQACRALSAVVPELPGTAAGFGGGAEPDDRVGALRGGSENRSFRLVDAQQRG